MQTIDNETQDVRSALRDCAELSAPPVPNLAGRVRQRARTQRRRNIAIVAAGCVLAVAASVPVATSLVPSPPTDSTSNTYLSGAQRSAGTLSEPVLVAPVIGTNQPHKGQCLTGEYPAYGLCSALGPDRLLITETNGIKVKSDRNSPIYVAHLTLTEADRVKFRDLASRLVNTETPLAVIVNGHIVWAPLIKPGFDQGYIEIPNDNEQAARNLVEQLRPAT